MADLLTKQKKEKPGRRKKMSVIALSAILLLSGCGVLQPAPFTQQEKMAEVKEIKHSIAKDQELINGPIDLHEAMARAVKYNLGYRLAMMEESINLGQVGLTKFSLLPKLTASAGYNHRDNLSASSSQSIATNLTSLESSTSQDPNLKTSDLTLSWNILDFGVSYFQAKQQADKYLVATERRRKALQNLIRDVRFAFWRAAAVQQLEGDILKILEDSQKALEYSRTVEKEKLKPLLDVLNYQKTLLEVTRQLEMLQEELAMAKIELAQLMNLPSGTEFELAVSPAHALKIPKSKYELEAMEEMALLKRPEIIESGYQKRISANETKKSIARLFPGITFRASDKTDSNSFILNNSWFESGVQLAWNLVNLISGPQTVKIAKNQEEVTAIQQMTLSMAVLSQVNISYRQYEGLIKQYTRNSDLEDINQRIFDQMKTARKATTQSKVEEIRAATNSIMSKLQKLQTYARLQNAFGRLYTAAGFDPLPFTIENYDVLTISNALKETMASWGVDEADIKAVNEPVAQEVESDHVQQVTDKKIEQPATTLPVELNISENEIPKTAVSAVETDAEILTSPEEPISFVDRDPVLIKSLKVRSDQDGENKKGTNIGAEHINNKEEVSVSQPSSIPELENKVESVKGIDDDLQLAEPITITPWVKVIDSANIRKSPSQDSGIASIGLQGDYYKVLNKIDSGWVQIQLDDKSLGWIYNTLVQDSDKFSVNNFTAGNILTPRSLEAVHVMTGPGMHYDQYGIAYNGRMYQVIAATNNWLNVMLQNGKTGWVLKRKMKTEAEYYARN